MTPKNFFVSIVLLLVAGCGVAMEEPEALLSSLSSERGTLQQASQVKTTGESQKLTANITSDPLLVKLASERSKLQQALNQQQAKRGKPQVGLLSDVEQDHQEALQRQMGLLQAAERAQPN